MGMDELSMAAVDVEAGARRRAVLHLEVNASVIDGPGRRMGRPESAETAPHPADGALAAGRSAVPSLEMIVKKKLLPFPSSLHTLSFPPINLASPSEMDSPSPVPPYCRWMLEST
jgi:hypothetical protein